MQYVVTAKLICLYSICIPCVLYEAMFCRHICAVHLQQLDRVALSYHWFLTILIPLSSTHHPS